MLLEVLVHAKLCEQRKCYPDSTHECRAKPLVSESNKESTVHKQWGVKKHFSQVLVADILKERKIQSCSQSFINIFYYNFFKVKCILFSAGSALQTEEGNTPLLLPEGSGCDCCNPANKQGRSHTALSIWGLEMSHSKKIPKGIHPIILFLLLQLPNTVSSNLLIHEGHCQLLRHRRALIKPPTLHSKGHGGHVARFSSFLLLFHLLCHLFLLLIPSYTLEVPFKRHGVQGHLILLEKERYLWNVKHFSICQNDPINANLEL